MIRLRISWGEIDLAEIICKKLLEVQHTRNVKTYVDKFMNDLNYVRRMLKYADAAYRSKDYLQVCSSVRETRVLIIQAAPNRCDFAGRALHGLLLPHKHLFLQVQID